MSTVLAWFGFGALVVGGLMLVALLSLPAPETARQLERQNVLVFIIVAVGLLGFALTMITGFPEWAPYWLQSASC